MLLCESLWQGETLIWERARQQGDPARAMLCERECVFDSASPEWKGKSDATSRVLTMIPVLTMRHSAKSAFSTPSRFILAMHFRPLLPQHCNKLKWKFGCGRARRKFSPPRHKAAQEAARSQIRPLLARAAGILQVPPICTLRPAAPALVAQNFRHPPPTMDDQQ